MLDRAFVSKQQESSGQVGPAAVSNAMLVGLPTYGPLTAMSAKTLDSSPFPVAKLPLYSACCRGGGNSVWQMGEYVFL